MMKSLLGNLHRDAGMREWLGKETPGRNFPEADWD